MFTIKKLKTKKREMQTSESSEKIRQFQRFGRNSLDFTVDCEIGSGIVALGNKREKIRGFSSKELGH